MAPTPKFTANEKKLIRQEISMGKIAEMCMIGREQVKTVLQSLSSQIVSDDLISHQKFRGQLSRWGTLFFLISAWASRTPLRSSLSLALKMVNLLRRLMWPLFWEQTTLWRLNLKGVLMIPSRRYLLKDLCMITGCRHLKCRRSRATAGQLTKQPSHQASSKQES